MEKFKKMPPEQTRAQILDAAEIVFNRKGVARTTLTDIAEAAGVTRGAVYWHFKNKTELFNTILKGGELPLHEVLDDAQIDMQRPMMSLRRACVRTLIDLGSDSRRQRVLSVLNLRYEYKVGEAEDSEFSTRTTQRMIAARLSIIFKQASSLGELRQNITPDLASIGLVAYIEGIVKAWLLDGDAFNLTTSAEELVDYYFHSLSRSAENDNATPLKAVS